jgi:L-lactate dehydrogenase complex protein LldG
LVPRDANLPELFTKRGAELKMIVTPIIAADAGVRLVEFLKSRPIRSVAISVSPLLEHLGVRRALESSGLSVWSWDELSLDRMYDVDCGVTDVDYAVAESGTLVIKPTPRQGRSMSLVPMFHVAFVEVSQILPDMVDLFDRLSRDPDRSTYVLISGPSKTADIEMNVVTGVHGPNVVCTFLVS